MSMKRLTALLSLLLALPVRAQTIRLPASAGAKSALPAALAPSIPGLPPSALPSLAAPAASLPSLAAPSLAAAPAVAAAAKAPAPRPVRDALAAIFARQDLQVASSDPRVEAVRGRLRAELLAAAENLSEPDPGVLLTVAEEGEKALRVIAERLARGEIDPSRTLRVSAEEAAPSDSRPVKVGVYPVAADPFQWGHLLIALRAVGELGVDKVVFVMAGDDPRKPTMTPAAVRHPLGRETLAIFAPFFEYSPIAVGTTLDGETNIFRILALNRGRPVEAWYMVGDDHYRLLDKKGNPDTLPKLERNLGAGLGQDAERHSVKVAFIKRENPAETVPTSLEVRFLDHVGFEASSTLARQGARSLTPWRALERARALGLYGLDSDPDFDGRR
jgi:hypothetical protein